MTFENATPTWGGYLPEAPLGSGGFSEVWAAREPISGEPVAIKRIPTPDAESRLRVAREVAALRQLRIPGVVRFRDHVSGDGCELIVMDRAPGKPFPNAPPQSPWSQIRAATLSMLRTLSGVHQAGLLHRDLKPANILVDEQGECTLLDFGLARHAYSGDTLTETGLLMGTPRYLAPEVWLGGRPGPAADLFAVGVMLYEALGGRAPYTLDPRRFGERTWQQRPPRLDQLVSGVPTNVAEIVERLLLPDPLSRPSSVAQLERQLYGPEPHLGPTLPFLGQGEAMARALEGLREGRSVRIAAPPGMGRRRFLREVAARWAAEAPAPLLLPPTDRAFGSLHAALSLPTPPAEAPLSEAAAVVTAALRTALDAGRRLFIDELDAPDRWSARLIKVMPALRLVAPSEPADGRLRALEVQELLPLFHGPERIFQIPSDAAAVLHARTGGLPAQVAAEVHAWVRAGRATWENGRLRLDRPTLDRFRAEAPRTWAPLTLGAALDEAQNEICAWLGFAGAPLDRAALLTVLPQAAWELDAHLEELAAAGRILRETPEGPVRLSPGAHVNPVWSQAERREAHARLAKLLPPGEPARLRHLLAVGDPAGLSAEAIRRARDLEQLGELGPALAILEEVLPVLAAQGAPLHPLAAPLSRLALAQGRPDVLRRVANRLRREIPESAPLPLLLDRFAELLTGSTLYPEQLWAEIPAFVNPPSDLTVLNTPPQESSESAAELEDWRLGLGVQAAARLGPERLREVLGEVQARRGAPEGPESAARYQGWQAQLLYQEEAYEAAALAHEASARGRTRRDAPAASYAQAASAWLMAGRLDEAERAARLAKEGARLSRSLIWSGWAELRLREVEARAGRATQPDLELVELSERLGNPHLHGLVCLNEAGIAWRRSVPHRARALARTAETALRKAGSHPGALLARALSLRCGETPGEGEIELLAMEAEILPWPGLSVQILALLSPETRADARALLQHWRTSALRIPRELCSGEEILGHLPDEIPNEPAEPTLRLDDAP